jgi:DNA gyrase subunit B
MSDADDDGCHIAALLLTFFYRYMRPLLTGGHLYLAQPPLYCVETNKQKLYCYTEEELQTILNQHTKTKVVRFKGLGEMDAEQLAETTMQPETRHLIQLEISDAAEAERMVSILMGSDVALRKQHIANQVNSVVTI